eukprot:CAMPEP_0115356712 /NCGR_PEP_ID=MMETSP0270-20121206/99755_1 /TAXON_ID=71861 /ORGANISM="Scrippsiella trochoidea, Strain CCMP3099" /LENGTH=122 /DNA_ID=CAMNT_0002779109 /DNA_START=36 /DNA_END=400 /DNA_ORIENTATION=-
MTGRNLALIALLFTTVPASVRATGDSSSGGELGEVSADHCEGSHGQCADEASLLSLQATVRRHSKTDMELASDAAAAGPSSEMNTTADNVTSPPASATAGNMTSTPNVSIPEAASSTSCTPV